MWHRVSLNVASPHKTFEGEKCSWSFISFENIRKLLLHRRVRLEAWCKAINKENSPVYCLWLSWLYKRWSPRETISNFHNLPFLFVLEWINPAKSSLKINLKLKKEEPTNKLKKHQNWVKGYLHFEINSPSPSPSAGDTGNLVQCNLHRWEADQKLGLGIFLSLQLRNKLIQKIPKLAFFKGRILVLYTKVYFKKTCLMLKKWICKCKQKVHLNQHKRFNWFVLSTTWILFQRSCFFTNLFLSTDGLSWINSSVIPKAVKCYVYVLSNWRIHRLSQYFDFPTQMNVLAFRSLRNFALICFNRDEKSHVTMSLR